MGAPQAHVFRSAAPIDAAAFARFLTLLGEAAGPRLLRVKGLVATADDPDRPWLIQGAQHAFAPPLRLPAWPPGRARDRAGRHRRGGRGRRAKAVGRADRRDRAGRAGLDGARRQSAGAGTARAGCWADGDYSARCEPSHSGEDSVRLQPQNQAVPSFSAL